MQEFYDIYVCSQFSYKMKLLSIYIKKCNFNFSKFSLVYSWISLLEIWNKNIIYQRFLLQFKIFLFKFFSVRIRYQHFSLKDVKYFITYNLQMRIKSLGNNTADQRFQSLNDMFYMHIYAKNLKNKIKAPRFKLKLNK